MSDIAGWADAFSQWFFTALERLGLIERHRARRVNRLVWPRIVTGLARLSQRIADILIVGIAIGPAGIAGIAFASAFWGVGNVLALGLSGGTVSLVSRQFGDEQFGEIGRVIRQSALVGVVVSIPIALAFWFGADELVGLLSSNSTVARHGATYLQVLALGTTFTFLNKVGSRALIGADDARTPMVIRSVGAVVNVAVSGVFVFVLGLGMAGVALGTVLSLALVSVLFVATFVTDRMPGLGESSLQVPVIGPVGDASTLRELVGISGPLVGRRLVPVLAVFPVLAIASGFGPTVVAALEVGRRVRKLSNAPNWGFSLASSSLIGQQIGSGDGTAALEYAWEILRLSAVVNVVVATTVFVFAQPITGLFVDNAGVLDQAVPIVRVAALSVVGLGIDNTVTGVLRSSGDTTWPLYGKVAYLLTIPVAAVSTPFVGIGALYALLLVETALPALFTFHRFRTGRWLCIGGRHDTPSN